MGLLWKARVHPASKVLLLSPRKVALEGRTPVHMTAYPPGKGQGTRYPEEAFMLFA